MRKGLVIFLRVLLVVVVVALASLLVVIFIGLMSKTKKDDTAEEVTTEFVTEAETEEVTHSFTDALEVDGVVPNGDAAGIDPDSFMADFTIYDPKSTEDTIHLPHADMQKFQDVIANGSGNDTSSEMMQAAEVPGIQYLYHLTVWMVLLTIVLQVMLLRPRHL